MNAIYLKSNHCFKFSDLKTAIFYTKYITQSHGVRLRLRVHVDYNDILDISVCRGSNIDL